MEDHQLQTVSWTEKSYPFRIQHEDRYFESKPEYAVQHWRREHTDAEMYVRTPATLDECGRHFIRHVLFDYGGNFGNNIPAQARLNYMDDRFRQIRHDFKVLYHSHPSPSSFAWTYFSVRMMLTRIAVATVSRRAAILFATEEYELMKRIAGCYDYLLLSVRGNWQPLHAPLVALMVLHLGMRSTLNVASSPYWCLKPTVEDPSAVYQLEQPTAAVDLAAAFQAVPPEAAASRDVQNSLLLLQALHAGEWFRFAELVVGLNLSFFQKCYAVSFLPFVRFRAVADTFGRPRKTGESLQKARLCDPVDVSYLTEKLLFANEDDCRSFLDDCGVVMANAPPNFNSSSSSFNNNNNNNTLVIYMQGTHPQQNQQQPSPTEMFDRLRSRKIKIDDSPVLEYGIYLPHPDFLNLDKAKINSTTPGKDDSSYYNDASDSQNIPIPNALMLIQQPDSLENDNNSEIPVCGSLSEWMQSVRDDVDHKKNPFDENSWTPLRTFAPSVTGVDVSAALVSFDRLIDHERSRLAARRVAVLGHKLLTDFKESVVIPLDELYLTEMRVFSSQEQRERRDVVEKLREQKKRKEQEEKSRKESELLAQKEKELFLQQQQQQQLDAAKLSAAATTNTTTQQKPGLFSSISSSKKLDELENSDGAPKIPTNSAVTSGNPFASSISASNNNNNQNFFATTTTTTTTTTAKTAQDSGNPFASSSSSINMNKATFATTKVEEKPAVSILHHQEHHQQQQQHSEKHVHFEPSKNQVVVFSKEQSKEQHEIIIQTPNHVQHDEEQQTRTFPFIDDRGYYSWLPTTIDQLKKMWTTFQNINNHDDSSSTFTNGTDSFFFPEYSKTKNINQQQQDFLAQQPRRVETDSVHLKIAVITPLDSVNPPSSQDYNSSTSSFDYYRTLTAATTSLFYDADSSDRASRLLCRRTFVNGDLVEIGGDSSSMGEEFNDEQNSTINATKTRLEEFERICNSPTFSVSAYNIPWNRSLELCSMLNFNIENRDNNNNIKSGGGGGGVLAVLVLPEFSRERNEISEKFQNGRTTQPAASIALKEFEALIGDFFSSFLRQEKFVTGKERKNGGSLLYPRGVVLLANISSDDREAPPPLFQECFERKWSEFRVKFAEMNRILNENHQNNSDKMLLHHQANKSGKNKSITGSKAIMSREEKLDALRRQRNWQDSSVFWNNFESTNNNSSNALSEDYATKSLLHALPPAIAPPMIIIPTKDNYVRATLGSAISDSMNVVMKEIRTRQIEKIY